MKSVFAIVAKVFGSKPYFWNIVCKNIGRDGTLDIFNLGLKFSIYGKFQNPRLKCSISLENDNPHLDHSPQKRALLCSSIEKFNPRLKFQISIENFNLRLVAWEF